MWLGIAFFIFAVAIAFNYDSYQQLKKARAELDSRTIDEIIRLLKIWKKDSDIFCEQMDHDRNNNTPSLNYNMAAHSFRSWLDQEIKTVAFLSKVWRYPFRVDLRNRITKEFDAQTREYINNCFPNIYYGDVVERPITRPS